MSNQFALQQLQLQQLRLQQLRLQQQHRLGQFHNRSQYQQQFGVPPMNLSFGGGLGGNLAPSMFPTSTALMPHQYDLQLVQQQQPILRQQQQLAQQQQKISHQQQNQHWGVFGNDGGQQDRQQLLVQKQQQQQRTHALRLKIERLEREKQEFCSQQRSDDDDKDEIPKMVCRPTHPAFPIDAPPPPPCHQQPQCKYGEKSKGEKCYQPAHPKSREGFCDVHKKAYHKANRIQQTQKFDMMAKGVVLIPRDIKNMKDRQLQLNEFQELNEKIEEEKELKKNKRKPAGQKKASTMQTEPEAAEPTLHESVRESMDKYKARAGKGKGTEIDPGRVQTRRQRNNRTEYNPNGSRLSVNHKRHAYKPIQYHDDATLWEIKNERDNVMSVLENENKGVEYHQSIPYAKNPFLRDIANDSREEWLASRPEWSPETDVKLSMFYDKQYDPRSTFAAAEVHYNENKSTKIQFFDIHNDKNELSVVTIYVVKGTSWNFVILHGGGSEPDFDTENGDYGEYVKWKEQLKKEKPEDYKLVEQYEDVLKLKSGNNYKAGHHSIVVFKLVDGQRLIFDAHEFVHGLIIPEGEARTVVVFHDLAPKCHPNKPPAKKPADATVAPAGEGSGVDVAQEASGLAHNPPQLRSAKGGSAKNPTKQQTAGQTSQAAAKKGGSGKRKSASKINTSEGAAEKGCDVPPKGKLASRAPARARSTRVAAKKKEAMTTSSAASSGNKAKRSRKRKY